MEFTPAERELEQIQAAKRRGRLATLATYTRLSGPGWLQGAITLGGGSLAGALYLGIVMGYDLMWLQPVAMILGVIMLSAISYVTLTTGERPFASIRDHISPLLAWGWLLSTIMANIVWSLPQFALGTAAIQQNLFPSLDTFSGTYIAAGGLLVAASIVVWFYNSGGWGVRAFEIILKSIVGIVVVSFFGVVIAMTAQGALDWDRIARGFIPNSTYLFRPVASLSDAIAASPYADWWTQTIAATQKDRIITAFATAVGINMTFLLPYSMLRKGWGRGHRGLAVFDLSIGLIVPFVLATGCVVIAAASQFHGRYEDVFRLIEERGLAAEQAGELRDYFNFVDRRIAAEIGDESFATLRHAPDRLNQLRRDLPAADRRLAAMLTGRDNLALAETLTPLVGTSVSQLLFGVGVLGMALSTIIILMLINGFAVCEMIGVSSEGNVHRLGSMIPAIGVLGPFVWKAAAPALATPTSVVGGAMLPIAYVSFLLLLNSRRVLGENMPTGWRRLVTNIVLVFATSVASFTSIWGLMDKTFLGGFPIGKVAIGALFLLLLIGVGSFVHKETRP